MAQSLIRMLWAASSDKDGSRRETSTDHHAPLRNGLVLVMVERPGCKACSAFDSEVAPTYSGRPEGRRAPLMRMGLRSDPPNGITFAKRVSHSPTFVLVRDGQEAGRMEGYVGQDFFWPVVSQLIADHGYEANQA